MHISICTYIHIHMYIYTYIHPNTHIHTCSIDIYIHTYAYIRMYIHTYIHIHAYINTHIYAYAYAYTCTYVHQALLYTTKQHLKRSVTAQQRGWEGLPKMDLNLSLILLSTTSSRLSSCSPRASPPHQLVESVRLSSLDASSPAHPCKEQRAGCHRLTEHLQWPATRQRT